jgi:hypothetical protein
MTGAEALPYPPDPPSAVHAVADRCAQVTRWVAHAEDALVGDEAALRGAWQGPAAAVCNRELTAAARLVGRLAEPLHVASTALRRHTDVVVMARHQIDALRRDYDDAVERARRDGALARTDDVAGPLRRLLLEDAQTALQAELAVLHRRHDAVTERVAEHARATARKLGAAADVVRPGLNRATISADEAGLAGLLPMLAAARTAAGVGARPPAVDTPADQVRVWWAALTTDERDRMVDDWPARLGALDGLPGSVRSTANEHRLALDVAMLRSRGALSDDERRWLANCLLVREQLARARAETDPVTGEPMTAQLLVFDPVAFGFEGRAAVSVGDVDTADNVAFVVPGLNSTIDHSMGSLAGNAIRVTTDARRAAPAETTATVAWMGYDAPGLLDVAFDGAAEAGADLLAADETGLQAARAVLPHLTVIGHSYGSTTVGTALRDEQTGTDDVVLIGSPGANVDSADELNVPPGHVFVGASSRDPVSYLDRFGLDPTHERFGAIRFEAEDPTRNSWRVDVDDHTKYLNAGTESLSNVVHVVTGDYAEVVRAPYREETWLLPDGINSDPESDRDPTLVP